MKNVLFILAGANGSGKTTLANEILQKYNNIEFVNTDEIAKLLNPDDLNSVRIRAGKIAINKINSLLDSGNSIIIETTLSGNYTDKIIRKAKLNNYEINLIYNYVDSCEMCIMRIKNRVLKGGHNVPDKDVIRRYHRSIMNFFKYSKLVDNWNLFYNGTECSILVASGNNTKINILNYKFYKYFLEKL